jgi:hypothetical protein
MLCCVLGGARIFIEQNHFTRTTYVEYAESEHGVTFLALACFGLVDVNVLSCFLRSMADSLDT